MSKGPVLVTGSAGFIGFHTARRLLARGETVIGLDNLNSYYDPALKHARLERLQADPGYIHHTLDLADRPGMTALFADAPECGCTFACSAPNSCFARSIASCSTWSTISHPP